MADPIAPEYWCTSCGAFVLRPDEVCADVRGVGKAILNSKSCFCRKCGGVVFERHAHGSFGPGLGPVILTPRR